ncbi:MAG: hypothetical protein ACJAUH_001709, partial [Saprospiraceae bacterium]
QYQWQSRTTGGWSNINGATGANYDPGNISQTTLYQRGARVSGCAPYIYSNTVTKTVTTCVNILTGTVFQDDNGNQNQDGSEIGQPNITVYLYNDANNNGILDVGETTPITTVLTAANGVYSFTSSYASGTSSFIIKTDLNSYPSGYALTTDNIEVASFTSGGNTDSGNDFGLYDCTSLGVIITNDNPNSCVGSNQTLTVTQTSGQSPYTYVWNNSLGNGAIKIVTPTVMTTYNVTVTDANGCTATDAIVVTVITNYTNGGTIEANEDNCGSFNPTNITSSVAAGGGIGGSLQYQWQEKVGSGPWIDIVGMTSATYDPNTIIETTQYQRGARRDNCFAYQYSNIVTKTVRQNPNITNITSTGENCNTGNGSITFTFTDLSDINTIEFSIDGGTTYPYTINDNTGSYTINNLSAGNYDLWVRRGDFNCPIDLNDVTINTIGTLLNTSPDQVFCLGEGFVNTSISATAVGGATPYTYVWDNGLGNGAIQSIVGLDMTTVYNVTVTDGNGCNSTGQVTITINDFPEIQFTTVNPNCGANDGEISFSFTDNSNWSSIEVSFDDGNTYQTSFADNLGNYTYQNRSAGIYKIHARWGSDDCPIFLGTATLSNNQNFKVGIVADKYVCIGSSTTLDAVAFNGLAPFTYTWSSTAGIVGNSKIVTVSPIINTRYTIMITDANACVAFETVALIADPCGEDCSNGIDDDGDGLIDCDDPECNTDSPTGISNN